MKTKFTIPKNGKLDFDKFAEACFPSFELSSVKIPTRIRKEGNSYYHAQVGFVPPYLTEYKARFRKIGKNIFVVTSHNTTITIAECAATFGNLTVAEMYKRAQKTSLIKASEQQEKDYYKAQAELDAWIKEGAIRRAKKHHFHDARIMFRNLESSHDSGLLKLICPEIYEK